MEESKNIKNQEDKTIRLIKWLSKHPKIQTRLCEDGYTVTLEECLEIIELLEENEFYDMIFVLFVKNSHERTIDKIITEIMIEKMTEEWKRIGTKQMCQDIKQKIKEEIQRKAPKTEKGELT